MPDIAHIREEQKPELGGRILTPDELGVVLAAAKRYEQGYYYPAILFAAHTGGRLGEVCAIQWDDIDFDAHTITVTRTKNRDYRVIPMTERVYELLQTRRDQASQAGTNDGRVLPFSDIGKSLHAAAMRAGIGHVHIHMLRHYADCQIMPTCVSFSSVFSWLGAFLLPCRRGIIRLRFPPLPSHRKRRREMSEQLPKDQAVSVIAHVRE